MPASRSRERDARLLVEQRRLREIVDQDAARGARGFVGGCDGGGGIVEGGEAALVAATGDEVERLSVVAHQP